MLSTTKLAIPAADTVSLGLHLRLSGEQLRKLQRWGEMWNVQLASERETSRHAQDLLGEVTVASERVQAVTYGADGESTLRPANYCRVQNLLGLVIQHLNHLHNSNQLTWHSTPSGKTLPTNEIWLKVGGDKGGGSLKFCFQVVNRKSPNSSDHTVVIAMLADDDNLPNMHVCIDPLAPALKELQGMKWR